MKNCCIRSGKLSVSMCAQSRLDNQRKICVSGLKFGEKGIIMVVL